MTRLLSMILTSSLLCSIFSTVLAFSAEENFLLVNSKSGEIMLEMGPHVDERVTPCSTFKIALSLMGFDSGILQDEKNPVWLFQEGYDDFLESWKSPQTPQSWMKTSCLWFSRVLAACLGIQKFQFYLASLDYGNQDASGGLTNAWLTSSLEISPREQVAFIQKMLQEEHPVSSHAIHMTRKLLFLEELPNGWKLFGKTSWSGSTNKLDGKNELGWFIGWIQKGDNLLPFAYNIRENKINLPQRIPRVKQLLIESHVMNETP
jgi:beta-lactamase class D